MSGTVKTGSASTVRDDLRVDNRADWIGRPNGRRSVRREYGHGLRWDGHAVQGNCADCSGPVEWSLENWEAHEASADKDCPNCGWSPAIFAHGPCTVCKAHGSGPPKIKVLSHPPVINFFHDHGVEIGFTGTISFDDVIRTLRIAEGFEEEAVSTDPPRVAVIVEYAAASLSPLLDGNMNVIDVSEGG